MAHLRLLKINFTHKQFIYRTKRVRM